MEKPITELKRKNKDLAEKIKNLVLDYIKENGECNFSLEVNRTDFTISSGIDIPIDLSVKVRTIF